MSTISESFARPAGMPPSTHGVARETMWSQVALLAVILFFASALRLILTPLQEAMKLDMGFSDIQVSMIQGVASGLPIAALAIPIGLAIDHANRARLMLALAVCWTVGTAWTAFAHDFVSLCLARALVGVGAGSILAVALSMIADLCMPARRGRVLLLAGVGYWCGAAMAFAAGGALFGHFLDPATAIVPGLSAWRQVMIVFAFAGVATLIPIGFFREPTRHEREQNNNAIVPALRALWRRRGFLIPLVIGQMAGGMAEGAAGIWAAPVLTRSFGLQPDQFGAWMGGMILFSGIVGSILGGIVADWGNNGRRRGGILLGAIVATLVSTPAAAYPIMPSVPLFGLALGALLLGCTVANMVGITAVTVLIPNEERGACMAIVSVAGTLVGLMTAPLVAWVAIGFFHGEQHMPAALSVLGVATGVLALAGYGIAALNAPAGPGGAPACPSS